MHSRAAITILRPREEVERLWADPQHRPALPEGAEASARFVDAPGDRGTEIHLELGTTGTFGQTVAKLRGAPALAQVKNELRRFKQRVETGEVPRSEAIPEGERVQRKFRQRPAQPLSAEEHQKVGV